MKQNIVAFTADIHYGNLAGRNDLENYIDYLIEGGVDILIIGGDLVSRGGDHENFEEALKILDRFPGKILFTPGNHDLWTREGDSFELLRESLPMQMKNHGHHLLDGEPYTIGNVGIVGSVGWYDYSFRKVPEHLEKLFLNYLFKFYCDDEVEQIIRWNEITDREYEGKRCIVSADGEKWKRSTWEDKRYIKWKFTDRDFLRFCINRLQDDIEQIYDNVESIIVVTHHLPYLEFVPDIPDPTWGFHRAYLGSAHTGDMLKRYSKVTNVFFGHSHRNCLMHINGIEARNVFFHSPPGHFIMRIQE